MTDMGDLIQRLVNSQRIVSDVCASGRSLSMSVPANIKKDEDLIITGALADAIQLLTTQLAEINTHKHNIKMLENAVTGVNSPDEVCIHCFEGRFDNTDNLTLSMWYNYQEDNELALPDNPELGTNPHAEAAMKALGITYAYARPRMIADSWTFYDCKNIPDKLPRWLTGGNK